MINYFKKKRQQKKFDLQLSYEGNGVKLWEFKNPLGLPTCRRLALFEALNDATLGVNSNDLQTFVKMCEDYANEGQYAKMVQLVGILNFYLEQHSNLKNLRNIANCMMLLDGETPDELNSEFIEKKNKLFQEDAEFRSFFLTRAYIYLNILSNQSMPNIDIEDYFQKREIKESEAAFSHLITEGTEASKEKI